MAITLTAEALAPEIGADETRASRLLAVASEMVTPVRAGPRPTR